MSDDSFGVLLTDGRSRVFLHPPKRYPDSSGFSHQVDLVGGPFAGSILAESYYDLEGFMSFHEDLLQLYRTLSGVVHLAEGYENFSLSLKGDGLGHITVKVEAVDNHGMDIRLTFGFEIEQTQLPQVISDVEKHFLQRAGT